LRGKEGVWDGGGLKDPVELTGKKGLSREGRNHPLKEWQGGDTLSPGRGTEREKNRRSLEENPGIRNSTNFQAPITK